MHPVVCLDRGFSSEFETEFGWYSKGSVLTVSSAHEVSDGLAHLAAEARAGAWIVLALNYEARLCVNGSTASRGTKVV
ncbi:hypothetical protein N9448_04400 [Litorivicinus sp.]|nr:hypothetical protein [Litorivicinus sp.]